MSISLTCKGCGAVIAADDEDGFVAEVRTHHVRDHGGAHIPSREHILARLHAQASEHSGVQLSDQTRT